MMIRNDEEIWKFNNRREAKMLKIEGKIGYQYACRVEAQCNRSGMLRVKERIVLARNKGNSQKCDSRI